MRFVPFHPAHMHIIETWRTEYPQVFIEIPDGSKPSLAFIVMLDETPVGWVEAFNIDTENRKAQVGIGFPVLAGRRIVVQAAKRFARILFQDLGLNRLYARVLAENTMPIKLLYHLGFREEGRERKAVLRDGQAHDVIVYGLLSNDWRD